MLKIKAAIGVLSVLTIPAMIGFTGCAEEASAVGEGPAHLEVVGGDTVDWGQVGGSELTHTLKLVNSGGDTLFISDVKPSCGCTTAPIDKDFLLPGDTANVDIKMDVANRSGHTEKTIRIVTNDSTNSVRTVFLRADVQQELVAMPAYFVVSGIKAGEEGSASIVLQNKGKEAITVQPPKATNTPLMDVRFSMTGPITLQPGETKEVTAWATPLNPAPEPVPYVFETSSKLSPQLKVSLNVATLGESGEPTGMVGAPGATAAPAQSKESMRDSM